MMIHLHLHMIQIITCNIYQANSLKTACTGQSITYWTLNICLPKNFDCGLGYCSTLGSTPRPSWCKILPLLISPVQGTFITLISHWVILHTLTSLSDAQLIYFLCCLFRLGWLLLLVRKPRIFVV